MIELTALLGAEVVATERLEPAPRVGIGRARGNGLRLDGPHVSRLHATIGRRGAGYVLHDLASTNGTFLAGARLTAPRRLNDGDRLGIGRFVVEVRTPPERAQPPQVTDIEGFLAQDATVRLEPGADEAPPDAGGTARLLVRDGRVIPVGGAALHLGRGPGCGLSAGGWLGPRKLALIVRGATGHTLLSFARPGRVRVNGAPAAVRTYLRDGDRLEIGGLVATFLDGAQQ